MGNGDKDAQGGRAEACKRHHPRPLYTTLLTKLKHLHRTVRGLVVAGGDDFSCVLRGVVHDWFVPPPRGAALERNYRTLRITVRSQPCSAKDRERGRVPTSATSCNVCVAQKSRDGNSCEEAH